ncbi:amino acid ABC transporter permease [Weizmannia coagulans]|uniref:Amino acid ABC transporter permease n=1 Tax=Heyndrickxia faecalis TaxID=2824910 RepID=A0ABV3NN00_9BACI|nr:MULTISPECIES: amino acid ABC transporter permease [Heyndrickxia]ATW84728.1 amino acid ABC transporter permease [Heyndrickxia coagulans]AWP38829.1 amino acid ABC transporter permease [Heyndrickxia coagulans]KGB29501.1 cysteine ABC transporter permease [Heyndrickxia coagulans]KXT19104.1 cysteine ABC transporter permease [Heyndrickxia coagulans]MBT2196371.1 amino acid ABC transporter permease [Heyndrickxia coagulans]
MLQAFEWHMVVNFIPTLLKYLPLTLYILGVSLICGFIWGIIVALPKVYKIPVLQQLSSIYISFFRGTPIMVQLFVVFYAIPALTAAVGIDTSKMDPLYAAIATYALSSAASIAEIIRAGINSVDKGQAEAAYSIGLTGRQTFFRIVLPQALVQAAPNFWSLIIGFLKDTSLAFSIGVMDMSGRGQTLITSSNHSLEVYISLAIIYYLTAIVLEKIFAFVEKHIKRNETRLLTIFDMNIQ